MATDKAQTLNNLRTKILNDSLANEGRNKYGLFSYPPAGVSGVANYEFNKTKMLGENGKPKTAPRGVFSGPGRSGKVESSYFAKTAYVTIGDKYVDPASRDRQYNNEKKKKMRHEAEFKPASGTKSDPSKALWNHKPEFIAVEKNYRGPDGKVVIPNRNIVTNPPKFGHGDTTIGHLLSKGYKHQPDPYNRPQELQRKEHEEHRKKLQEAPFRTVSHGNQLFVNTKKTFGKDDKIINPANPQMRATLPKLHENAFRPSNPAKHGYNKTISKFPEYKPDPIRIAVRQIVDPSAKKDAFRPNSTADYERPTPSISLNKQNLKNEMARISQSPV
jgi:hypothetical protein